MVNRSCAGAFALRRAGAYAVNPLLSGRPL